MVGNLISDSVKGKDWQSYPKRIAVGLLLHREIDYFTDTHPIMRKIIVRNRPFAGKYAGPVTDILCDFLLVQLWPKFEEISLDAYILKTYEMLTDQMHLLPKPWPKRLEVLITQDWLNEYRTKAGMAIIFSEFTKRLRRPVDVEGLFQSFFEDDFEENITDFEVFYLELQAFCLDYLNKEE